MSVTEAESIKKLFQNALFTVIFCEFCYHFSCMLSTKFSCCCCIDEFWFLNSHISTQACPIEFQIKDLCSIISCKVMSFNLLRLFVTAWCSFSVRMLPGTHFKMAIKFLEALWNSANFSLVEFKEKNTLDNWMHQLPEFLHLHPNRNFLDVCRSSCVH
jgi:hypothetical protein